MFKVLQSGLWRQKQRVLAPDGIDAGDEYERLAVALHTFVRRAHKVGFVAARKAAVREPIVTHWNGVETTNIAEPDSWVVANMDASRTLMRDQAGNANIYVVPAANFPTLYEVDGGANEFGDIYRAKGEVDALYVSGGFMILAPWGEMQQADTGYLLRNNHEVYGNDRETFERTYSFNA